jgi:hypothetical protein
MYKLMCALAAAAVLCVGCSDTTKDTAKSESTHKNADGKEVKTETSVEKKTTVDK